MERKENKSGGGVGKVVNLPPFFTGVDG